MIISEARILAHWPTQCDKSVTRTARVHRAPSADTAGRLSANSAPQSVPEIWTGIWFELIKPLSLNAVHGFRECHGLVNCKRALRSTFTTSAWCLRSRCASNIQVLRPQRAVANTNSIRQQPVSNSFMPQKKTMGTPVDALVLSDFRTCRPCTSQRAPFQSPWKSHALPTFAFEARSRVIAYPGAFDCECQSMVQQRSTFVQHRVASLPSCI